MKINKGLLRGAVVAAASTALAVAPSAAFAQGGPPAGHGGGPPADHGGGPPSARGRGGGATETSNNLSVPTIMVGGGSFPNATCTGTATDPSPPLAPSGDPKTGYPVDSTAYYYVQGENTWQAQCFTAMSASADAAWGDNLTGDAALTVGHPIRVELALDNTGAPAAGEATSLQGYNVIKLNEDALDREAPYGTLASGSPGNFTDNPQSYAPDEWHVYDGRATVSICRTGTSACPVASGTPAPAEINATGNVVYGYNLRVSTAGAYTIKFTTPDVNITGSDAGALGSTSGDSASITIEVTDGGGGGGAHHGGS